MTAFNLIDSISSRHQDGVLGNQRRISQEQYDYLRNLISEDPEGGAFKPDGPGEMIWVLSGQHKDILTDAVLGKKRLLTSLSNLAASASGRLF
jgi:hypothetical protein